METADVTPYSTIQPYLNDLPYWVPEEEQERCASYFKYDDIYWSRPEAFKLALVDEDAGPIYVPKAKVVVDTTAHYLLKGLTIAAPSGNARMKEALDALFKREKFYSKFHTAKHSGVTRGDFVLHITADQEKQDGKRISITSVHPAAYFPVYDEWDPDKLVRVHLAEQFEKFDRDTKQLKVYIRRMTYEYEGKGESRRVWRSEGFFEEKDWFDPKKQKLVRQLMRRELLPPEIKTIPVYHFKNVDWQGEDFGSSELRGFERLLIGINQSITDEEVALALEGLGVYATDAAGPVDPTSNQRVPWTISPAKVMEVPTGSYFKRVEGINSVTPMLEHVKYLEESLFGASGTTDVARGAVEATVAQSGIALAIKFLPTLAKVEIRDQDGLDTLDQFWHDWKAWHAAFESEDFGDAQVEVSIGDKLPQNKTDRLNELNNMFDRGIIDDTYYRDEMEKLGDYVFPEDMADRLEKMRAKKLEDAQKLAEINKPDPGEDPSTGKSNVQGRPPAGQVKGKNNRSNNKAKPNESAGKEARA